MYVSIGHEMLGLLKMQMYKVHALDGNGYLSWKYPVALNGLPSSSDTPGGASVIEFPDDVSCGATKQ